MRLALLILGLAASVGALEPLEADPAMVRRVAALRCPGPAYALADLLAWQRRSYSQAVVTSGFLDPRGVSRYRSQPGLHLGYDIAMPAGSPVLAAWPGTAIALVPWADGEWGVVVEHADGTRATYGHVAPQVQPGAAVVPGMTLGLIAVDHLDVKMRDARGEPLDYGGPAAPSRERLLADWWLARLAEHQVQERRRSAGQQLAVLKRRAARREEAQELGLWTPREARRLENELQRATRAAEVRQPVKPAAPAGLTWEEVRALARRWGELHPELKRRPARAERPAVRRPLGSWR